MNHNSEFTGEPGSLAAKQKRESDEPDSDLRGQLGYSRLSLTDKRYTNGLSVAVLFGFSPGIIEAIEDPSDGPGSNVVDVHRRVSGAKIADPPGAFDGDRGTKRVHSLLPGFVDRSNGSDPGQCLVQVCIESSLRSRIDCPQEVGLQAGLGDD